MVSGIGDDGIEGTVRVVPTSHSTLDAGLRGVGAAGVAVAVHGLRRRDLRVAAGGDGGGDGGAGRD